MIQPYDRIDEDDAFIGFGMEGIALYDSLSLLYFRSLDYLSETSIFSFGFFYDDVTIFFSKFPIFSRERETTFFTKMSRKERRSSGTIIDCH